MDRTCTVQVTDVGEGVDEQIVEVGNQGVEAVPLVTLRARQAESNRVHDGEEARALGCVRGALVRVAASVGDLLIVPCLDVGGEVVMHAALVAGA